MKPRACRCAPKRCSNASADQADGYAPIAGGGIGGLAAALGLASILRMRRYRPAGNATSCTIRARAEVFNLVVTYHNTAPRRLKDYHAQCFSRITHANVARSARTAPPGEHTPIHNAIMSAKTSEEWSRDLARLDGGCGVEGIVSMPPSSLARCRQAISAARLDGRSCRCRSLAT